MGDTANIIVTHQSAPQVARMLDWWKSAATEQSLWIAYGGKREEFAKISWPQKFFLTSNRIRTANPQRERQSYQEVFQLAVSSGALDGQRYVHLAEYDQMPLQPALNMLQSRVLNRLRADVLGYRLQRVDGTNHPHDLYHRVDPAFGRFIQKISRRNQPEVILSFLGFGSFWTVEAFRAVAAQTEPTPVYLELWMPTVAHHLGFRVRRIDEPEKYHQIEGDVAHLMDEATAAGIWNLHPMKSRWNDPTTTT
jgi:hypothetical protein